MFKKAVAGIFALTFTGYVSAATTTYTTQNWNLGTTGGTWSGSGVNKKLSLSSGTVNVTISAWSSTGDGVCGTGIECGNSASRDDDPFVERARLTRYTGSGLGAINQDEGSGSPDHALDNRNGGTNELDFDMVLFEFDSAVELESIQAGWYIGDSDASVLGYAGTQNLGTTPFSSSTKWSDLLNQGWAHSSNSNSNHDMLTNVSNVSINFESRYWLVGAYNPVFTNTSWSHRNDAFKLEHITTRQAQPQTQIPEPTTLALMLAGVALAFRRKFTA